MTDLEKASEAYATGNHRASFPDTVEKRAFEAGARWGIGAAIEYFKTPRCPECGYGPMYDLREHFKKELELQEKL